MALSRKIKKILETESAVAISKDGQPRYVVMTWDKYRELAEHPKKQEDPKRQAEEEGWDGENDIDISRIPV
jgi:PHD/YefM family antitoxin component YafN of YafNO toxin-antitoxin module